MLALSFKINPNLGLDPTWITCFVDKIDFFNDRKKNDKLGHYKVLSLQARSRANTQNYDDLGESNFCPMPHRSKAVAIQWNEQNGQFFFCLVDIFIVNNNINNLKQNKNTIGNLDY